MATINGSNGSDTLNGTAGDDEINGLDANDTISGGAGNDTVFGGNGNDTVNGNDGDDTLYGEDGSDTLGGDAGNDTLFGGAGYDSLYGDAGDDVIVGDDDIYDDIYGGDGNDTIYGGNAEGNYLFGGNDEDEIYGGSGFEIIEGGAGNDRIYAGAGNDTISGEDGDDQIEGGAGNDSIYAGVGNDAVQGGDGDDLIQGQQGNDTLFGGAGADVFEMADGAGNDTIFGGSGATDSDLVRFVSSSDVTVTFSASEDGSYTQNGGTTQGTFDDIEVVETAGGNDTIDATLSSADQTIYAGGGDDTVFGGTGDDSLFGGAGNDTLEGNSGNDTLDGGSGNDTIHGNAGNDTITTGTGNDTIVFDRFGGDDVVTDFDLTDTDSNGFYNDQLDVSALRDLGGNPVNVGDVTVTDDGGFARLSFPEGESILLQGVTPAQMSSNAQLYAAGIPCFTASTLIRTPRGDVPITTLRIGDQVTTRDNGPQPILWIGTRRLAHADLVAAPKLCPIRISPGAFDNSRPAYVSPQHGMLLRFDKDETLVRATHLARMRGGRVRQAKGVRSVTYVHLLFEAHQIIFGDDLPSESFYPGPCARDMLKPAQLQELGTLFPALSRAAPALPRARPFVAAKTLPDHIRELSPAM